ncbi:BatD family protein [Sulfurimonas sp.]|uniref:BatD family protein n=1 Tax=Sulfurimonas sp. TaxID=2022749 RepID=UPI0025D654B8|nr:BatD family protein [Sulfurimonas sp.]
MKNLGKIALLLLLAQYIALASVRATVDATNIEVGEMITYSLHISGEDVQRPNIHSLCGTDVISTSARTSIEMINGDISRSNILSYKFMPQRNCIIEPIEVEIDGTIQKSNSVEIKVGEIVANKDADFILVLDTSTKEVFVGEAFDVTLLFKQKRGAEAVDSKFVAPELKGFWIKNESKPQRSEDGKYAVSKVVYTMAAQRVGKLNITKAQMRIASRDHVRDSWGAWIPKIKWRTYYSNELSVDVKPLPGGVELVGNFSIIATADKTEINPSEALNLTIEVLGDGNLEDIKSFKPYINGVNIFDEKIVVRGNKLTQKIAFVAERDFTIAPFILKYFDPITKEIKTISTNEINIKVKNAKPKEELTIKREEKELTKVVVETTPLSNSWVILIFILGLILGALIMFLKPWIYLKKEKSVSIKDHKVLLIKLLPHKNDEQVQNIVDILEKNIYSDAKIDLDKKLLKEIIKKYNLV